jgi:hypothetical protein
MIFNLSCEIKTLFNVTWNPQSANWRIILTVKLVLMRVSEGKYKTSILAYQLFVNNPTD